jgi:flagellar biosynthesis/type III secretory pathway protein FliH
MVLDQLMLPEVSKIAMTAAEQLREEGRRQGLEKGLEKGRKEGQKQGRERSQRENLLTLLNRRFGPLPARVRTRVRRAELVQLQRWFDRGITARTLDAVFADEP